MHHDHKVHILDPNEDNLCDLNYLSNENGKKTLITLHSGPSLKAVVQSTKTSSPPGFLDAFGGPWNGLFPVEYTKKITKRHSKPANSTYLPGGQQNPAALVTKMKTGISNR